MRHHVYYYARLDIKPKNNLQFFRGSELGKLAENHGGEKSKQPHIRHGNVMG